MPNLRSGYRGRLLVLALILMGVVFVVALRVVWLHGNVDEVRRVVTISQLAAIQKGLELYEGDHGRLPSQEEGLAVLLTKESPYLDPTSGARIARVDRWEHPLIYRVEADGSAAVISLGADGQAGGTGTNADLIVKVRRTTSQPVQTESTP